MLNTLHTNLETFANKINGQFDTVVINPIGAWLDKHPNVNTIVVIANHILRTLPMMAAMHLLPFSFAANCAITLGASLFYRISIERFCVFRFAIPSCLGAIAFQFSKPALADLISKTAFQSFSTLTKTLVGLSPFALYMGGIVWISYAAVQEKKSSESCCHS